MQAAGVRLCKSSAPVLSWPDAVVFAKAGGREMFEVNSAGVAQRQTEVSKQAAAVRAFGMSGFVVLDSGRQTDQPSGENRP